MSKIAFGICLTIATVFLHLHYLGSWRQLSSDSNFWAINMIVWGYFFGIPIIISIMLKKLNAIIDRMNDEMLKRNETKNKVQTIAGEQREGSSS